MYKKLLAWILLFSTCAYSMEMPIVKAPTITTDFLKKQLNYDAGQPYAYLSKLQKLTTGLVLQESLMQLLEKRYPLARQFEGLHAQSCQLLARTAGHSARPMELGELGRLQGEINYSFFTSSDAIAILLKHPNIFNLRKATINRETEKVDFYYRLADNYEKSSIEDVKFIGTLAKNFIERNRLVLRIDGTKEKPGINWKLRGFWEAKNSCYSKLFDDTNFSKQELEQLLKFDAADVRKYNLLVEQYRDKKERSQELYLACLQALNEQKQFLLKKDKAKKTKAKKSKKKPQTAKNLEKYFSMLVDKPEQFRALPFSKQLRPLQVEELAVYKDAVGQLSQSQSKTEQKKSQKRENRELALQQAVASTAISTNAITDDLNALKLQKPEELFIALTDLMFPDVQHHIFKTDSQKKVTVTGLNYTNYVQRWLKDPKAMLDIQLAVNPAKFKYRETAMQYHAFSSEIDKLVFTFGQQTTTKSRRYPGQQDILITLPGKMIINGTAHLGLYTYIVDAKTNECYHRLFEPRAGKELIEEYMQKGYYDVEFPPLEAENFN